MFELTSFLDLHKDRPEVASRLKQAFSTIWGDNSTRSVSPKILILQSLLTLLEFSGDIEVQSSALQALLLKDDVHEYKIWFAQQWFKERPKCIREFIDLRPNRDFRIDPTDLYSFLATYNDEGEMQFVQSLRCFSVSWNQVPVQPPPKGSVMLHVNCGSKTVSLSGIDWIPEEVESRGRFLLAASDLRTVELFSQHSPYGTEAQILSVSSSLGQLTVYLDPLVKGTALHLFDDFLKFISRHRVKLNLKSDHAANFIEPVDHNHNVVVSETFGNSKNLENKEFPYSSNADSDQVPGSTPHLASQVSRTEDQPLIPSKEREEAASNTKALPQDEEIEICDIKEPPNQPCVDSDFEQRELPHPEASSIIHAEEMNGNSPDDKYDALHNDETIPIFHAQDVIRNPSGSKHVISVEGQLVQETAAEDIESCMDSCFNENKLVKSSEYPLIIFPEKEVDMESDCNNQLVQESVSEPVRSWPLTPCSSQYAFDQTKLGGHIINLKDQNLPTENFMENVAETKRFTLAKPQFSPAVLHSTFVKEGRKMSGRGKGRGRGRGRGRGHGYKGIPRTSVQRLKASRLKKSGVLSVIPAAKVGFTSPVSVKIENTALEPLVETLNTTPESASHESTKNIENNTPERRLTRSVAKSVKVEQGSSEEDLGQFKIPALSKKPTKRRSVSGHTGKDLPASKKQQRRTLCLQDIEPPPQDIDSVSTPVGHTDLSVKIEKSQDMLPLCTVDTYKKIQGPIPTIGCQFGSNSPPSPGNVPEDYEKLQEFPMKIVDQDDKLLSKHPGSMPSLDTPAGTPLHQLNHSGDQEILDLKVVAQSYVGTSKSDAPAECINPCFSSALERDLTQKSNGVPVNYLSAQPGLQQHKAGDDSCELDGFDSSSDISLLESSVLLPGRCAN